MIPILYESTEKEFTTQGIGALSDAISCSVTEERNNTYELEMEYAMDGVHYDDIKLNNIIMAIPSDNATPQAFRIYQITRPINGKVTVYAEHISYQLSNIPVKPFSATGVVPALQGLVDNSIEDNPFTVWTDIVNAEDKYNQTEPASFRSRLGGVTGSIIDCFGGEYEFDMYTVKLHAQRGSFKEVTVEYGKNLTDIEQEELLSNVVTGIVPFWKSNASDSEEEVMMTLPEYVVESENADKYPFKRTIVKDFSQDFDSQPTEAQLRSHTESYIKNNAVGEPEVSIDFDFVELSDTEEYKGLAREHIKLCDTIVVKFSKLGINQKAKVRKTVYDVLGERYTSLSIGSSTNSFVKTISEIQKETEKQVTDFASMLKNALALQKAIMDGNLGGYMVTNYVNGKPAELVFGDTDDISTMQHCLRIGKDGIAFSTTGYDGEYTSAWTIDGTFDGQFIKAGSISGNSIQANSITVGALSDELASDIEAGTEAKELAQANKETIDNLQNQIDGAIETWFYDYAPSDSKAPTSEWTTTELKNQHLGDLFYDSTTGYSYRYTLQDGAYSWVKISDSDITKALEEANKAQAEASESLTVAKTKMRVFITTPVPPYAIGDIWVQGSGTTDTADSDTTSYIGDIMYCSKAKASGESFDSEDWSLASNYTDDTIANMAKTIADAAREDSITANELAESATNIANDASTKADSAQSSADYAKTTAESAKLQANQNQSAINSLQSDVTDVQTQVSAAQSTADSLQAIIDDFNKDNRLSDFLQRTEITTDGISISAINGSSTKLVIQNDGMRFFIDGKEISSYLAEYSQVAKSFFESGRMAKHLVQKFTIDSVEGTAFFYDEKN